MNYEERQELKSRVDKIVGEILALTEYYKDLNLISIIDEIEFRVKKSLLERE